MCRFCFTENVVPVGIDQPKMQFSYTSLSSMSMECMVQNDNVYSVQYWMTWTVNNQQRKRELLSPGVTTSTVMLSTLDFISLSAKVLLQSSIS
jgi:hypothetical protein